MNINNNKVKEIYHLTLKLQQALNEFNIAISKITETHEEFNHDNKYSIKDFDQQLVQSPFFGEQLDQNLDHKRTPVIITAKDGSKISKRDLSHLKKQMDLKNIKTKTPLTPFFLFMKAKRDLIVKQFPHLPQSQISKLIGNIWSHFTEQQKKPYLDSFEISKVKYKSFVEKKLSE